ncbi:hypothetical protein ACIQXW_16525 [Lysinibacillus sp. NPDC097162]|uniref:hypothetical protein n=1 Tax=Lysinibacillus sp. NPDC097162 TaxID=3364140 RepID=UPI0038188991
MRKSVYKSAMEQVKINDRFKEETYKKFMQSTAIKEEYRMKNSMKLSLKNLGMIVTVCTVLTGTYTMIQHSKTDTQSTLVEIDKPQTTAKAVVNIEGTITEVNANGNSFKIGDLWVTVTNKTQLGIKGPTAAKPSEELLQKEFKVGNFISGYTSQDVSTGKVTADVIYNNMAPVE